MKWLQLSGLGPSSLTCVNTSTTATIFVVVCQHGSCFIRLQRVALLTLLMLFELLALSCRARLSW
jgi:hypothetical protein